MYRNNSIDSTINYFKNRFKNLDWKFNSIGYFHYIEEKILKKESINKIGGNLLIAIEYAILDAFSKETKIPIYFQNFLANKGGRNPAKQQSWDIFYDKMKELEKKKIEILRNYRERGLRYWREFENHRPSTS